MSCCFCKLKTTYEMRISDWSSDVCSSDLSTDGKKGATARQTALEGLYLKQPPAPRQPRRRLAGRCRASLIKSRAFADRPLTMPVAIRLPLQRPGRSEERRYGKEVVSTGSTWWVPRHVTTNKHSTTT